MTLLAESPVPWETRDPAGVLAMAEDAVQRRREAELDELLACATWADLHGSDPRDDAGHTTTRGGERLVPLGGEGTPEVRDLGLVELGVALSRHTLAARAMTADVLDLRHRLPRTWRAVMDGDAEVWVARKVAAMSRAVPVATVAQVDAAVAGAITGVAPSRLFDVAEAAVICADPAGHRATLAAERTRRYVGLTQPDGTGLRTLVARLTSGDAIFLDAMVHRVADILAVRRHAAGESELGVDRLRSEALGWLARPAELLALLLEHGHDPERPAEPRVADDAPEPYGEATRRWRHPDVETVRDEPAQPDVDTEVPGHVPDADPVDPDPIDPGRDDEVPPEVVDEPQARPFALPTDVLAALTPQLLARLRPEATLYVHLHESSLAPLGPDETRVGVTRVEGSTHGGPLDVLLLGDLLGHHRVRVTPVVDNRETHAVDAYEHPAWMRERIHLRSPADAFPHARRVSRAVDLDHPWGYDPGGPPGQTTTDSQPLSRTAHRARTHLGYTVTPTPAGIVWRTPHGLLRLVDTHGRTHHLTAEDAAVLIDGQTAIDAALDAAVRRFAGSPRSSGAGDGYGPHLSPRGGGAGRR